jgi:hypothetical protein
MSKNQDKQKSKPEQKQIPDTQEKQKIESTELTDADLDKVSGGGAQPHMVGTTAIFKQIT